MRHLPICLISLTIASGCDRAPDPNDSSTSSDGTRYHLARVGSDTLPAPLSQEGMCLIMLKDGLVTFSGSGNYSSEFSLYRTCVDQPREDVDDPGTAGRVRISRDTAYFSDQAGMPAGHGILTADSLVVQGSTHRLVYIREQRAPR